MSSVKNMDITTLDPPHLIETALRDGLMVCYCEAFTYADCFEFEHDSEIWGISDQYCVG